MLVPNLRSSGAEPTINNPAHEADWGAAQLQGEYFQLGPTMMTENAGTARRQS